VDYRALLLAPAAECRDELCLPPSAVSAPAALGAPVPSEGPASGGTRVSVAVAGLPCFAAADVTLVASSGGGAKAFATVVELEQGAGASLRESKGTLTFLSPAADADAETVEFVASCAVDTVRRSFAFSFDYLPVHVGPVSVSAFAPAALVATDGAGETTLVTLSFSLCNVPRLRRPFDPASVLVRFGMDKDAAWRPADAVTASDRNCTAVEASASLALAPGFLAVAAYSAARGASSAASGLVPVAPVPPAAVASVHPTAGSAGAAHTVAVTVRHLAPDFSSADVAGAALRTAQRVDVPLALQAVRSRAPGCALRACSLFELTLKIPALGAPLLAGGAGTVSVRLAGGARVLAFPFASGAAGAPVVRGMWPRERPVGAASADGDADTGLELSLLLADFPRAGCGAEKSCAVEAARRGARVLFGGTRAAAPSKLVQLDSGELQLSVPSPAAATPGSESVAVTAAASGALPAVATEPLTFTHSPAAPAVAPVDVALGGGALVTVTAAGVRVVPGADEVQLLHWGGGAGGTRAPVPGAVVRAASEESAAAVLLTVVLSAPALKAPGVQRFELEAAGASGARSLANFTLEYFAPPRVARISAAVASLDGRTGALVEGTTELEVESLPALQSAADVALAFGDRACAGAASDAESSDAKSSPDAAACGVEAFVNYKGGVWLRVRVPPAAAPGTAPLSVTFVGSQPPPLGAAPGAAYARAPRTAAADFAFVKPPLLVRSVRWCRACAVDAAGKEASTCIVGGRCAGGAPPLEGRAPAGSLAGSVLTLVVENAPALPAGPATTLQTLAKVTAALDEATVAPLRRVGSAAGALTALEFALPAAQAAAGARRGAVAVLSAGAKLPLSAAFDLELFDAAVALSCGGCAAPAAGAAPLLVNVSNLFFGEAPPEEALAVTFGNDFTNTLDAAAVELLASGPAHLALRVTPPRYDCAACAAQFAGGAARVTLRVALRADLAAGAAAPFAFWRAPAVAAARLDALGLAVDVEFDQPTDRAGMGPKDSDCGAVLAAAALAPLAGAAGAAQCVWRSAALLRIMLGVGASLIPGTELELRPGALRSANRVSPAAAARAAVLPPALPMPPAVAVWFPSTVDQCSPLTLRGGADSPRAASPPPPLVLSGHAASLAPY
jgi:hypothetical protein